MVLVRGEEGAGSERGELQRSGVPDIRALQSTMPSPGPGTRQLAVMHSLGDRLAAHSQPPSTAATSL